MNIEYTTITTVVVNGWPLIVVMLMAMFGVFLTGRRYDSGEYVTGCLIILAVVAILSIWVGIGWTETVTEIVPAVEIVEEANFV